MTIPVINYSAQQPQGYPAAQGLMEALAEGLKLGRAPKNMRAQEEKDRLSNALAQIQLQYAPDMNKEKLQAMQMHNKYYAPNMESQINLSNTQNRGAQLTNQFYPENMRSQIDLRNTQRELLPKQFEHQKSRFNEAYNFRQLANVLQGDQRKAFNAENSEQLMAMIQAAGNQAISGLNDNNSDSQQNFALSEDQINALRNAGIGTSPDNNDISSRFNMTPEQKDRLTNAFQISANKALSSQNLQKQIEGAIQIREYMDSPGFMEKAKNASEFAGILGKGEQTLAQLSQTNPPAYEDYLSFVHHDEVVLSNRIKRVDDMGATDAQREELNNMFKETMHAFSSNPEQFMTQLNLLKSTLSRLEDAVFASGNKIGYPTFYGKDMTKNNNGTHQESQQSNKGRTLNPATGEFR